MTSLWSPFARPKRMDSKGVRFCIDSEIACAIHLEAFSPNVDWWNRLPRTRDDSESWKISTPGGCNRPTMWIIYLTITSKNTDRFLIRNWKSNESNADKFFAGKRAYVYFYFVFFYFNLSTGYWPNYRVHVNCTNIHKNLGPLIHETEYNHLLQRLVYNKEVYYNRDIKKVLDLTSTILFILKLTKSWGGEGG